jgi:hypothetical protein
MANTVQLVINALDKTKPGSASAVKNLNDISKAAAVLGPVLVASAAAIGASFAAMVDSSIDLAEGFNKAAQKAGTTVEGFSAMSYAAKLADVSNDQLVKTYRELGDVLTKAAQGGNAQAALFKSIGLSATDAAGRIKTTDQVLLEIADTFADTADDQNKVIIATKLFGDKLGQELIPFLNQGAAGIRELQHEGKLLGQVFTGQSAKSAEQFKDNLDKLKMNVQGLANVFVMGLVPGLEKVTGEMTKTNKETHELSALMREMAMAGEIAGRIVSAGAIAFTETGHVIDALIAKWKAYGNVGLEAFQLVANGSKDWLGVLTQIALGPLGDVQGALLTMQLNAKLGKKELADAAKVAGAAIENDLTAKLTASQKVFDELFGNKLFENIGKNLSNAMGNALLGGAPGKMPTFFDPEAEAKNVEKLKQQMLELANFKMELHVASLSGDAQKVAQAEAEHQRNLARIQELATSKEQARLMEADAEQAFNLRLLEIQGQAIAQRLQMEQQAFVKQNAIRQQQLQATSQMFGNMAQAAQAFGKKGFEAYKGFAIAQTTIDTYSAAMAAYKAMAGIPYVGPALGIAAAAAAVAAGMARVASIKSTSVGQAHAGLSMVPEESTYILQRGERVLAPEQNRDLTQFLSGGGQQMRVIVNLDGRAIFDAVSDASRTGLLEIDARAVA